MLWCHWCGFRQVIKKSPAPQGEGNIIKERDMKTIMEIQIEAREQLRQSEIRFWQKTHPKAKVTLDKNQVTITYPFPTDFDAISKFLNKY